MVEVRPNKAESRIVVEAGVIAQSNGNGGGGSGGSGRGSGGGSGNGGGSRGGGDYGDVGNGDVSVLRRAASTPEALTAFAGLDALTVDLAARPRDGEANAELCRFTASILGVPKSRVSLVKGGKNRRKTVAVEGVQLEAVGGVLMAALLESAVS